MKNKCVVESFHKITPSEAAKERMLNKAFERYLSEESSSEKVSDMKRAFNWKRLAPVAACLVVAVAIGIPFLNGGTGDFDLPLSDKGISVNYTDKVPNGPSTSGLLVPLTEEQWRAATWDGYEIVAFSGTVKEIKYVEVDFNDWTDFNDWEFNFHVWRPVWTIYSIEVEKPIRGDVKPGETVSVLFTNSVNYHDVAVEDTEGLSRIQVGSRGVFRPIRYDETSIYSTNGKSLCLLDVAQYGFLDGTRWAQLVQPGDAADEDLDRMVRHWDEILAR